MLLKLSFSLLSIRSLSVSSLPGQGSSSFDLADVRSHRIVKGKPLQLKNRYSSRQRVMLYRHSGCAVTPRNVVVLVFVVRFCLADFVIHLCYTLVYVFLICMDINNFHSS